MQWIYFDYVRTLSFSIFGRNGQIFSQRLGTAPLTTTEFLELEDIGEHLGNRRKQPFRDLVAQLG